MGAEEEQQGKQSNDQERPNPVTEAQFLSWKRRKDEVALAKRAEAASKRAEDIAAGTVQLNGRELFLREPWVFDNNLY